MKKKMYFETIILNRYSLNKQYAYSYLFFLQKYVIMYSNKYVVKIKMKNAYLLIYYRMFQIVSAYKLQTLSKISPNIRL